jgi:DNA polymerase-3 subunit alpha
VRFAHLHVHSDFSLLDGANRVKKIPEIVSSKGMTAVALTDHGNLFGAIKFMKACEERGVKPVVGCEVYVAPGSRFKRERGYSHLTLLCQNSEGYANLIRIVSAGHLEGFYYKPRVDKEVLSRYGRGLFCLSGCLKGEVPQALSRGDGGAAAKSVGDFVDIFGRDRFYIELQDHGLRDQHRIMADLLAIAGRFRLGTVATNDCHYSEKQDAEAHDVLLCIQMNNTLQEEGRMRFQTGEFYLKSPQEMMEVFGEVPGAVERTQEIADACEVKLSAIENPYPSFGVPEGHTLESYLDEVIMAGYRDRGLEGDGYLSRIRHEIDSILGMGLAGYFLIVWDFVRFARGRGIRVGPGRGSVVGSLASYCLGITDVDPMKYGLLFERFLNPDRVSMPDIDIDFCMNRRSEVIEYVASKYGKERVAQIITFGTLGARAGIRDVARVLGASPQKADGIAKMIPFSLNITIDEALSQSEDLRSTAEEDPEVRKILTLAKKFHGFARHASMHAAGVIITPGEMQDSVPLFKTNNEEITTQYDMGDLERLGLLKIDFLGLTTLTIIEEALGWIESTTGKRIDIAKIPLDDGRSFTAFCRGETDAVFQFETPGMRDMMAKYGPRTFEDLIAINSLNRPGPIQGGMVDDYIRRHKSGKAVKFDIPVLEEILSETYGVIVYQEQVIKIAHRLAGFSLAKADMLRRAMGKKKPEDMQRYRLDFVGSCEKESGLGRRRAAKIFDLMAQFAGYGFNKSHSTAYALIGYQTMWLKTNYPVQFMSAVLNSDTMNRDKMRRHFEECARMGVKVMKADVNSSGVNFTPDGKTIRFGLSSIMNVGVASIKEILHVRNQLERFEDVPHFVSTTASNRRVVEALARAGALDSICRDKEDILTNLDNLVKAGARSRQRRATGQEDLF